MQQNVEVGCLLSQEVAEIVEVPVPQIQEQIVKVGSARTLS